MKKDRFGICMPFYAVLGFVLAILGQTLLCGMLVGFAILAVQDEWAARQTMQAFFLTLIMSVVNAFTSVASSFYWIPFLGRLASGTLGMLSGIFALVILVFAVIGIVRTAKGAEANLPLCAAWANKAYGMQKQVIYKQEP